MDQLLTHPGNDSGQGNDGEGNDGEGNDDGDDDAPQPPSFRCEYTGTRDGTPCGSLKSPGLPHCKQHYLKPLPPAASRVSSRTQRELQKVRKQVRDTLAKLESILGKDELAGDEGGVVGDDGQGEQVGQEEDGEATEA